MARDTWYTIKNNGYRPMRVGPLAWISPPTHWAKQDSFTQVLFMTIICFHNRKTSTINVWIKHASRFPYCVFVRYVKGADSCVNAEVWKHRHGSFHLCECALHEPWEQLSRVKSFQQVVSTEAAAQGTGRPTSGVHRSCYAGYRPSNKWCPPNTRYVRDRLQVKCMY